MGDHVTVFDGEGTEARADMYGHRRKRIRMRIGLRTKFEPLRCAITLAQPSPRGKHMDLIVQRPHELGAARYRPLVFRSHDRPTRRRRRREEAREVAGDCRRGLQAMRPEIGSRPFQPRSNLRRSLRSQSEADLMLIASLQPDARRIKSVLAELPLPLSVCVLVGPEEDFTPAEVALAKSKGCRPITLGPSILRAENRRPYRLSVLAHWLF